MVESKPSAEDVFRNGLQAVVDLGERLSPYCQTVEDLVGIAQLGLTNDGQFRLLLEMFTRPAKR